MNNPWQLLGIAPTNDVRAIKRAYAALLKQNRPEDDPDAFRRLRLAMESALQHAARSPASGKTPHREAEKTIAAAPLDAAATKNPVMQSTESTESAAKKPSSFQIPPEPIQFPVPPDHLTLLTPPEQTATAPPAPKPSRKPERPPAPAVSAQAAYDVHLRPAADVVDELLRQVGAARFDAGKLDLHLQQCPELLNLNNQTYVEALLLQRLAEGAPAHPAALLHLVVRFAWRELGTAKRLGSANRSAHAWLNALERRLHLADFEHFLSVGPRLTKAPYEHRREVRLLGALHQGLTVWRKWFIALFPSTRKVMCDLINAYRKQHGLEAADQVFGVAQLSFWDRLNVKRGLNLPRFVLFQLRIVAIGLVFEILLLAREIPTALFISVSEGKPLFSQVSYVAFLIAICTALCCAVFAFISMIALAATWLDRTIKKVFGRLWQWLLQKLLSLFNSAALLRWVAHAWTASIIVIAPFKWLFESLRKTIAKAALRIRQKKTPP